MITSILRKLYDNMEELKETASFSDVTQWTQRWKKVEWFRQHSVISHKGLFWFILVLWFLIFDFNYHGENNRFITFLKLTLKALFDTIYF